MGFETTPIESYCLSVSHLPSTLCEELAEYTRKNVQMSIMLSGPLVASVLGSYISAIQAKRILEIGTYTGYSALSMAERLPADGKLITIDLNPNTMKIARDFWEKSPHRHKISGQVGPASELITELTGTFDFVFIDANKTGYQTYCEQIFPRVRSGGVIACDNCLYEEQVLLENPPDKNAQAIKEFNAYIHRLPQVESVLLPIRDGLHIITKL